MKIKFVNMLKVPEEYAPVPASKVVPDWYKRLESYTGGDKRPDGNAGTTATAKRCMPIFDAISAGYIIFTHTDLYVSQKFDAATGRTDPYYEWANFGALGFHPKTQLPEHPADTGHDVSYPKWTNSWSITTPEGYSSLFISPLHRETPIIALPGVVDTDTYTAPVNFPFVLRNPKMEGLIPAGTPIMQVIPFKRDEWEVEVSDTDEDIEEIAKVSNKLRTKFFDSYKTQYRQPKEFK